MSASPIHRVFRRRTLIAGTLATAALTAAGCANTDAEPVSDASEQPTTRDVTDSLKRIVTISTAPQRIVSLQDWANGLAMLSIGAPLAGMVTRSGAFMPQVADQFDLSAVAKVGEAGEWDLEKIAALGPDLIVGSAWEGRPNVEGYDVNKLQAIAPTYFIEDGQTTLHDYMEGIGLITGRQDEVTKQKAAWKSASITAKKDLATKTQGLSFALVGWFDPTYYVATPANPSPLIRIGLEIGLQLPAAAAKPGAARSDYLELSAEKIDQASADLLYWGASYGDPTGLALWSKLPAVKAGQAIDLGNPPIGWSYHEYTRALKVFRDTVPRANAGIA